MASEGDRSIDRRLLTVGQLVPWLALEVLWGASVALRPESLPLLLAAVAGLAMLAVVLRAPVLGLYVFVAAMLTEAAWMLGSVSAARLLGIVVLVAWVAGGLARGRFIVIVPAQACLAGLFILWALLSGLWTMDRGRWLTDWLLLLQSMALFLLVVNLVTSAPRLRVVLAIVTAVSLALALLTVAYALTGRTSEGRVDLGHISAGDRNLQAAYFLPAIALSMAWFSQQSRWQRRVAPLLVFCVLVMAILATGSRGAMIALAAMLILGALVEGRLRRLALPSALLGGLGVLLMDPELLWRLRTLVTLADRGSGRVDMWLVALRVIRANPLLGVGLGSFRKAFDKYLSGTPGIVGPIGRGRVAHNILLHTQSELGIVGLVLLCGLIAWTLDSGLSAVASTRRAGSSAIYALALAVFLGLAGVLVAGMFLDALYWKFFWVLLALPEVVRRLSVQGLHGPTS